MDRSVDRCTGGASDPVGDRLAELRLMVSGLIDRAERAEATSCELQATLDYVVSLLIADDPTRRAALGELFGGGDSDGGAGFLLAHDERRRALWEPVVLKGGIS